MAESRGSTLLSSVEHVGRTTVKSVEEAGYIFALLLESLYWIVFGYFRRQPVRIPSVFAQMMTIGIAAIPIVVVLSFAIGIMLPIVVFMSFMQRHLARGLAMGAIKG